MVKVKLKKRHKNKRTKKGIKQIIDKKQNTRYKIQNAEYRIQNVKCKMRENEKTQGNDKMAIITHTKSESQLLSKGTFSLLTRIWPLNAGATSRIILPLK